ncbi:hypothetical protein OOK31_01450 [Streptomyces sp. NBC_00249]|uniref:hypothetical protein n=1 Tax=Streptomyces sp. NBC_00249 TaxID=2975690 RepID=UPI00224EB0AB|nr:hypothetical protein [Streptomyces sp. NBC_00249]MCX5192566.1 hypothetical protein [Streptomyces sp. NBC_00249]
MITVYRFLGCFGGDVPAHRLRAAARVHDRSPDGPCVRRGEGWALVSGRTAFRGRVAAVLDGEIDNRLALFTRLEVRGHAVADRDGSAVLRAAFELDGAEFAEHLDGAYAAAVVDARAAPVLVLATDDAGTTPLYYHWDPGRGCLRFASEIPALLALLTDPPGLWEPGLDAYLTTGAALDGATLIDGVRMLPPGTTAVCSRGRGLSLVRRAAKAPRTAAVPPRGLGGPGPTPAGAGEAGADAARLPELLPELLWRLGQPDADPGTLGGYLRFGSARRAGERTALAPDPVGEIAEGRARVEEAVRARDGVRLARYADALAPVPADARSRLYSADYRAYLADRGDAALRLAERLGAPCEAGPGAARGALTRFELEVLLPARGLRRLAHLSGAQGVRARLPVSPRRAWEAAEAAEARPGAALGGLLTGDGPLAGYVREVLAPGRLRAGGLLDPAAVRRLLDAQAARPDDRLAAAVWALLTFEVWREEYALARRTPVRLPARPAVLLTAPAPRRAGRAASPDRAGAAGAAGPG